MPELPCQKAMWNAYGHALGAAGGLELTMRVALLDAARKANPDSEEDRKKALSDILGKTFGGTITAFLGAYPQFKDHEVFPEAIENARAFRNYLAHHFLEGKMAGLRTQEGVELITLECIEYTDHFKAVEGFVRETCEADFDGFFGLGADEADSWVENHPLLQKLKAIKSGELTR